MPIQPLCSERCFFVRCSACGITETMIFQGKSPLPVSYRYMPTVTCDSDGNEIEKHFQPVKGLLSDKPPKHCPNCGGELKATPIKLYH